MCDSKSKPKFKAGDKIKCVRADIYHYVDEGEIYTVKEYIRGYLGVTYVVLEEIERDHSYNIDRFELVVDTPKNYRELTPDTLIDISIDGNEFEVPLGDLIHTEHLLGVSTGTYGYNIWKVFNEVLDKEKTLLNNQVYSRNDTLEQQRELIKIYFIDKEKKLRNKL